jgi:hypothetical protein
VLVIAKRYGPAHQAQYRRPPVPAEELPDLRSSSDITWLAWKPFHDKGVKLKHIITWSVVNGGTQRLIAAALEEMSEPVNNAEKELKPYPWVGWRAGGQRASLILVGIERATQCRLSADSIAGSPNGIGIAFMLGKTPHLIKVSMG